jgi:hypothetical protein
MKVGEAKTPEGLDLDALRQTVMGLRGSRR